MSSFADPHFMYLFATKNGKKKLAYGASPQDALEILSYRLSEAEMALIERDEYTKIPRTDLQKYIQELG